MIHLLMIKTRYIYKCIKKCFGQQYILKTFTNISKLLNRKVLVSDYSHVIIGWPMAHHINSISTRFDPNLLKFTSLCAQTQINCIF